MLLANLWDNVCTNKGCQDLSDPYFRIGSELLNVHNFLSKVQSSSELSEFSKETVLSLLGARTSDLARFARLGEIDKESEGPLSPEKHWACLPLQSDFVRDVPFPLGSKQPCEWRSGKEAKWTEGQDKDSSLSLRHLGNLYLSLCLCKLQCWDFGSGQYGDLWYIQSCHWCKCDRSLGSVPLKNCCWGDRCPDQDRKFEPLWDEGLSWLSPVGQNNLRRSWGQQIFKPESFGIWQNLRQWGSNCCPCCWYVLS